MFDCYSKKGRFNGVDAYSCGDDAATETVGAPPPQMSYDPTCL